jgi:hypothetical protein
MVVDDFQEIEALAELGVSAGVQRRLQPQPAQGSCCWQQAHDFVHAAGS